MVRDARDTHQEKKNVIKNEIKGHREKKMKRRKTHKKNIERDNKTQSKSDVKFFLLLNSHQDIKGKSTKEKINTRRHHGKHFIFLYVRRLLL